MQKRYRGLLFIGLLLKIIGIFELIIGFSCLIIVPLVTSDQLLTQLGLNQLFPGSGLVLGILLGGLIFLLGLVAGLLTFSAGELFNVIIAIEENTRATLKILQEKA